MKVFPLRLPACGVETFNLNKAVKRNIDRFPADFMFQLSGEEAEILRFQIGNLKACWPWPISIQQASQRLSDPLINVT